jgi:hypothetical protein
MIDDVFIDDYLAKGIIDIRILRFDGPMIQTCWSERRRCPSISDIRCQTSE